MISKPGYVFALIINAGQCYDFRGKKTFLIFQIVPKIIGLNTKGAKRKDKIKYLVHFLRFKIVLGTIPRRKYRLCKYLDRLSYIGDFIRL